MNFDQTHADWRNELQYRMINGHLSVKQTTRQMMSQECIGNRTIELMLFGCYDQAHFTVGRSHLFAAFRAAKRLEDK